MGIQSFFTLVVASFIVMKILAKQLQERLSTELKNISDEVNAVKGYDLRRDLLEEYIKELKEYVAEHPFPDKATEIHYYKHVAPVFYQQYYYFSMLHNLELERITADKKNLPSILQNELAKANHFLAENHDLHLYFYSRQDFRDEDLFTRDKSRKKRGSLSLYMDDHYCEDSRLLALILAFEQYRNFLDMELEEPDQANIPPDTTNCKATKSDAVNLAVSMHEAKWFHKNGELYTLDELIKRTERYFNKDLKDYKELDRASRGNQGDPAVFAKLKTSWTKRKERLDDENDEKR